MSEKKVKEKPDYTKGNPSGLIPKGRAVLTKPYDVQKQTSLIELPPGVSSRMTMFEDRVIVVAIGPACWDDEAEPRAKVGERVMISKLSGNIVIGPADGETYRVINDKDIYVGIEVAEHLEI